VPAALSRFGEYIDQAATFARPIAILPGSGINSITVRGVLDALLPKGLQQVHMSGGRWYHGPMLYRREGMGMGVGGDGEWGVWRTDVEEVRRVRRLLDSYEA
jgi:copper homeostasis protein